MKAFLSCQVMECRSALLSSSFLNSPGGKGTVILTFKCLPRLQGPQVSLAQGLLTETVMRNAVLISHAETGRHVSAQQACGQSQDTGLQGRKCPTQSFRSPGAGPLARVCAACVREEGISWNPSLGECLIALKTFSPDALQISAFDNPDEGLGV